MFILTLLSDPAYFFATVGVVVFSVCLHEYSHAVAALSQGDDTAKKAGYLTLNPMVHMGPLSLLMLAVIGIAWGQTPVNPSRFHHPISNAIVAFAGPLMNLFLLVLFTGAFLFLNPDPLWAMVFQIGALINAVLFLFNMIPVPPLDGYAVLETLLPPVRRYASVLHQYGFIVLLVAFFLFGLSGVLFESARWLVGQAVLLWSVL